MDIGCLVFHGSVTTITDDVVQDTRLQRLLVVLGIVVLAFNLRPAASSVGPLLEEIRAGVPLGDTQAGILTTLPVICFAVVGGLAPRLARSEEHTSEL